MRNSFKPRSDSQVLVVGDVILDRYLYGETTRISPEAPVPVVRIHSTLDKPGGAANVALNVKSLGVQVQLVGITGEDDSAELLARQLADKEASYQFIHQAGFPTITKVRIMSQHQQLLRLDYESLSPDSGAGALYQIYTEVVEQADSVILSDYAKGSLQSASDYIKLANRLKIPVLVDPKGQDFSRYRNASIIVPYIKELEAIVGTCESDTVLEEKASALCRDLALDAICVTRGQRGMSVISARDGRHLHLPAQTREIYDVTGVGDTVVATLAAALSSGYTLELAAQFANQAACIVIEKLGTATVTAEELNTATRRSRREVVSGLLERDELSEVIAESREAGERIVMAFGGFDILDAKRVGFLAAARLCGDRLLVAVNQDSIAGRRHDDGKPINRQPQRMQVVAGLRSVDWVTGYSGDTPMELLKLIKPDVLVHGGIGKPESVPGSRYVRNYGGEVRVIPDREL